MNTYESLAEQMLLMMDRHKHLPAEPVSGTIRGEMAVLRLLSQIGTGQNPGEIAARLNMTTSRIAAVLNSLEKKQLILRISDPSDRRRMLVSLTEKGEKTCLERREDAKNHLIQMLMRLSEEDAETFVRLCEQLFAIPCDPPPIKEV